MEVTTGVDVRGGGRAGACCGGWIRGSNLADFMGVVGFLKRLLPLELSVVLTLASLLMGLGSFEEEGMLGDGEGEGWNILSVALHTTAILFYTVYLIT
jgi:hypothetical protein